MRTWHMYNGGGVEMHSPLRSTVGLNRDESALNNNNEVGQNERTKTDKTKCGVGRTLSVVVASDRVCRSYISWIIMVDYGNIISI